MNVRPTRGQTLSWVACWLGAGCATYESTPPEGGSPTQTDSAQGGGKSTSLPGSTNPPGTLPPPGGAEGLGTSGTMGVGGVGDGVGGSGSGQAGESSEGGASRAPGSAGNASAGGPALGPLGPWSFDTDAEGWEVRDHSPALSPAFTSDAGSIRYAGVAFTETKEFLDFAYAFPTAADLSGRTLRARLRKASGGFVGVQLYVYGGAWASGGFVTLGSASFSDEALVIDDITSAGFTKTAVSRIGLKISTGSNSANSFGPTSLEIDEVSLALSAAAGATQ